MVEIHAGAIYQPPIIDCIPGFIHLENTSKGDEGSHSVNTICPACYADLKFYGIAVAGEIREKVRNDLMKIREKMVTDYADGKYQK
jgi:hypothetical protein